MQKWQQQKRQSWHCLYKQIHKTKTPCRLRVLGVCIVHANINRMFSLSGFAWRFKGEQVARPPTALSDYCCHWEFFKLNSMAVHQLPWYLHTNWKRIRNIIQFRFQWTYIQSLCNFEFQCICIALQILHHEWMRNTFCTTGAAIKCALANY